MSLSGLNWAFLLRQLVQRDIEAKHKGTAGGVIWLVAQPLLMLAIYTLVFGLIFQPRWRGIESIWDYALILFLGKIAYIYVLESVGRAPALIAANASYVKKSRFPLDLLVLMSQATALVGVGISFVVWGVFYTLLHKALPPPAAVLVPLVFAPLILSATGVSLFLASLGTYFRDVAQIVQPILFSMMFLSPVFYPIAQSPAFMKPFLRLNPMSQTIEQTRNLLYFSQPIDWHWLGSQALIGLLLLASGWWWFRRTKRGFAEVL